jgi:hypothetical protein
MKRTILFLLVAIAISCTKSQTPTPRVITQADYLELLKDSVGKLNGRLDTLSMLCSTYEQGLIAGANERKALTDSLERYQSATVMTSYQFVQLYKYARLQKYYKICKHNPTQWKYYKGWSARVFEE